jgi:hypothetical protein
MKVLYESVIAAEQRHRLGEYYTPDWLAERMVSEVVDEPLVRRCSPRLRLRHAPLRRGAALRSRCGRGRHRASAGNRRSNAARPRNRCPPLAVTFARVTYLLAIGRELLQAPDRPNFHLPVHGAATEGIRAAGRLSHAQARAPRQTGGFDDSLTAVSADACDGRCLRCPRGRNGRYGICGNGVAS